MSDLIESKEAIWNARLRTLMTQAGLSQSELASAINEKYKTSYGQKDVSRWMNVGKVQKNGSIGFPKYDTMLIIADYFGVDTGYLTGETPEERFDLPNTAIFLGLEMNTIRELRGLTQPEEKDPSAYTAAVRRILDGLISSKAFKDLLLNIYSLYSFSPVSGVSENNRFEQQEIAEHLAKEANDKIALSRYKVSESLFKLLDDLYPYASPEDFLVQDIPEGISIL